MLSQVRVRLGDKIGYIPKRCFELPAEGKASLNLSLLSLTLILAVYKDYTATNKTELTVKNGNVVGIIDSPGEPIPEGFLKVSSAMKHIQMPMHTQHGYII